MSESVRVLIVEDSADDAELLLLELRRGGHDVVSDRVETAAQMRAALTSASWDLIISDFTLPEFGALAALELAKEVSPDLPFIVVSGTIGEEMAVRAMRGGASDYVLKNNLARLGAAMSRELRSANDRREWKQAERKNRELAALVESSQDAIIGVTGRGLVSAWNPGAERLFGYSHLEMIGQNLRVLIPADRATEQEFTHDLVGRGERQKAYETVRLRKDGSRVDVSVSVSPIWNETGQVIGGVGIVRDITDRKKAEALVRLRDRAIQAVASGIIITDALQPDNPIIYASPGFERMTGYSQKEALGRNCRFLQGKDTDRKVAAELRASINDAKACDVELLNYRKDGSVFWNRLLISPVHDEEGRLTHFVGVQTDVTERRQLEEQFRQAQKMEAVGRLAGGVAHDFNNLLTIINGYGEIVLNSLPDGDRTRDLVREITNAGERAAGLTRQLLAFSRKTVLEPKVVDVNTQAREMACLLRRLIGEDIELATSLDPDLGRIKVDPGQLEQAVINLCVNARDAMPQGGKITLETQNVTLDEAYTFDNVDVQAGNYVLIAVSDTGHGMDTATKTRLFEPFFTTKEQGKGTGLGLAMVYGFVKQSLGHIAVTSEPGKGATFKIYLPRVEQSISAKSHPGVHRMPRGTETLFLVEDEPGVRALARHALQSCGYTVVEACDGKSALRAAERHAGPIHLLVTDVVMPNLGGRQVAEGILALHPEAKVLFMSGYTNDAVVRHGVQEANANFLQKPFTSPALAQKVREVLDRS